MAKKLTDHFAVTEDIHRAVKSVAAENGLEINEFLVKILLNDNSIKTAYNRIIRSKKDTSMMSKKRGK